MAVKRNYFDKQAIGGTGGGYMCNEHALYSNAHSLAQFDIQKVAVFLNCTSRCTVQPVTVGALSLYVDFTEEMIAHAQGVVWKDIIMQEFGRS